MYTFSCSQCKTVLTVTPDSFGKKVACPRCGQKIQIPAAPANKSVPVGSADVKAGAPPAVPAPPAATPPGKEGYFVVQDGKRAGPFSLAQLQDLVAQGKLKPAKLVLPAGSQQWVPAAQVPQLFPSAPVAAAGADSTPGKIVPALKSWARSSVQWLLADRRRWLALGGALGCLILVILVWRLTRPGPDPSLAQAPDGKSPQQQLPADKQSDSSKNPKTETPAGNLGGQQIYEKALKSTVWINNPGLGFGSGALINAEDRLVLTNYHVVFRGSSQGGNTIQTINGILTNLDPRDKTVNLPYKLYPIQLSRGNAYVISMVSQQFDTYLQVVDAAGQVLAFDDDSGGNLNALLRFVPPVDGKYGIVATTYSGGVGSFTLKVSHVNANAGGGGSGSSVAPFLVVNFPAYENGRVIAEKSHYQKLNNAERDKYKATVVAYSEAKDLAVLKLNYLPPGVEPLALDKESSRPGQAVHSIGNPAGSGALWVYTSGTVRTAPYQKKWQSSGAGGRMNHDASVVETQSPTNPGDSGGPLVNDQVRLVAVTQGNNLDFNSISLFVDVGEVRNFLRANNLRWTEK